MSLLSSAEFSDESHPLDRVEELFIAQDWVFDRRGPNSLIVTIHNPSCAFHMSLNWLTGRSALQISVQLDHDIPADRIKDAILATANINAHLWCGHFVLTPTEPQPIFSYTCLGQAREDSFSRDHLARLLDSVFEQCEKYAPVYHCLSDNHKMLEPEQIMLLSAASAGNA